LQTQPLHEPLDRAAGHRYLFAIELTPDLVCTIDLKVGMPDTLDLRQQGIITLGTGAAQGRIAALRSVAAIP
jgi:hypothetical protein